LASVERGEATRLGKVVLELFESNDNNGDRDEQQLLQQVKELVDKSRQVIQTAKDMVDNYGEENVQTEGRVGVPVDDKE
jgi:hypothetical protein